jgi:hypothetical protein
LNDDRLWRDLVDGTAAERVRLKAEAEAQAREKKQKKGLEI